MSCKKWDQIKRVIEQIPPPKDGEPRIVIDKYGTKRRWIDGFWSIIGPTREQEFSRSNYKCCLCDEKATEKLHQAMYSDDRFHDLNNYYCSECFMAVISPFWPEEHQWLRKLVKAHKSNNVT